MISTKAVCVVCAHSTLYHAHVTRPVHCEKCGGPTRLFPVLPDEVATVPGGARVASGPVVGEPVRVQAGQAFTAGGMTVTPGDPEEHPERLRERAHALLRRAAKLDAKAARAASADHDPADLPMDVLSVVAAGSPEPEHFGAMEPERNPEMPPGMP